MDIVKYMALQLAAVLKPENSQQMIAYADDLLDWMQEDNPIVDDETDGEMEVVFTPEGTER
jgi:hypothetical protein